jgi:hypothetical protein
MPTRMTSVLPITTRRICRRGALGNALPICGTATSSIYAQVPPCITVSGHPGRPRTAASAQLSYRLAGIGYASSFEDNVVEVDRI